MKFSPLLDEMMKALQVLPGVGPKSAQRMAFTLLERERSGGLRLAQLLNRALNASAIASMTTINVRFIWFFIKESFRIANYSPRLQIAQMAAISIWEKRPSYVSYGKHSILKENIATLFIAQSKHRP